MPHSIAADARHETGHIFAPSGHATDQELIEILASHDGMRIERIVSHGQCSPDGFWYDQDEDEWVLLLSGAAAIAFACDESLQELKPGDYLLIPAGKRHRVAWTSPQEATVWLAIFSSQPLIATKQAEK
ncbi:cupin domain-containing protein [Mariprofundus erugo]|uniref:Cupin domain-containing protein n=1 Tax=Mariprofundus erugo TaxID=2528639 RepID=A0A5R9GW51_9PROT|nr:cupin domain-containing protein [Mariprofundus erugo]TLS69105.1 cupin domain-containing protein [Mariprofundus erugo]TLS74760.1 cupin domain-containing protein [Mariprofundus erugo]